MLLKGGTVVNGDASFRADVLVRAGKIAAVGPDIEVPSTSSPSPSSLPSWLPKFFFDAKRRRGEKNQQQNLKTIDCSGLLVLPGAIDPHTHLDAQMMGTTTADDFYSGTRAALAGGTTTIIDFALPRAGDGDLLAGLERYERVAKVAACDYGFHVAVTNWSSRIEEQIGEITRSRGINSFKFFLAYKGAFAVDDATLMKGFEACRRNGALAMVHCENADAVDLWQKKVLSLGIAGPEGHALSRPSILEDEGTKRALSLAALVGAPLYVVHVMSAGAAALVAAARNGLSTDGPSFPFPQRVWGEAVVSGIAGDDSKVFSKDFRTAAASVMSPPIRSARHREALRAALAGGGLSVLATDHAVFNASQKSAGKGDFRLIPNGVNGIEERLVVAWDALVAGGASDGMGSRIPRALATPSRLVELVSAAPAKLFGLYPRKGVVAPGSDADLVLFDPLGETVIGVEGGGEGEEEEDESGTGGKTRRLRKHHSRVDTNVYEGKRVKGRVATTIFAGEIVWDGEELTARRGAGRRLELPAFADAVFGGLERGEGEAAEEGALFIERWKREFPYGELPVRREEEESLRERAEL